MLCPGWWAPLVSRGALKGKMSAYNLPYLDLLAEHRHVAVVLGQGPPGLRSRPWTWRHLTVQGTITKKARYVGPGCSQSSASIAGCFSVESYCRWEGPEAVLVQMRRLAGRMLVMWLRCEMAMKDLRALAMCQQQMTATNIWPTVPAHWWLPRHRFCVCMDAIGSNLVMVLQVFSSPWLRVMAACWKPSGALGSPQFLLMAGFGSA